MYVMYGRMRLFYSLYMSQVNNFTQTEWKVSVWSLEI